MQKLISLMDELRTEAGSTRDPECVELIGKLPDAGPNAWQAELFAPLTEEELASLAAGYRCTIPEALLNFYRLTNGLNLYDRHFSISGMPEMGKPYKQPFALVFTDGQRPRKCPRSRLFFGMSGHDEPRIQYFFDTAESTGTVYACMEDDAAVIGSWPSLEALVCEQLTTLRSRYRAGDYQVHDIAGVIKTLIFD